MLIQYKTEVRALENWRRWRAIIGCTVDKPESMAQARAIVRGYFADVALPRAFDPVMHTTALGVTPRSGPGRGGGRGLYRDHALAEPDPTGPTSRVDLALERWPRAVPMLVGVGILGLPVVLGLALSGIAWVIGTGGIAAVAAMVTAVSLIALARALGQAWADNRRESRSRRKRKA